MSEDLTGRAKYLEELEIKKKIRRGIYPRFMAVNIKIPKFLNRQEFVRWKNLHGIIVLGRHVEGTNRKFKVTRETRLIKFMPTLKVMMTA